MQVAVVVVEMIPVQEHLEDLVEELLVLNQEYLLLVVMLLTLQVVVEEAEVLDIMQEEAVVPES
jgi:hypothetical protein